MLEPLDHDVVLPQGAGVVAQGERVEVVDQPVADAVVVEVVAPAPGDLLAQVAAEAEPAVDDVGLLQQVEVALHGVPAHPEPRPELGDRDLPADLEGERLQQAQQLVGVPDAFELQDVLEQVGRDQLLQVDAPDPRSIPSGRPPGTTRGSAASPGARGSRGRSRRPAAPVVRGAGAGASACAP